MKETEEDLQICKLQNKGEIANNLLQWENGMLDHNPKLQNRRSVFHCVFFTK